MTQRTTILGTPALDFPQEISRYRYDPELGFLSHREGGLLKIVGLSVPLQERFTPSRSDDDVFPSHVYPRVRFDKLPESERIFGKINRGVGPRLYNTVAALRGTEEDYDRAGIYAVEFPESNLLDMRHNTAASISVRAEQAGKWLYNRLFDEEALVNLVHSSMGDVDAVLFDQTPDSRRKQKEREVTNPKGVPAEFIVVRNSLRVMRRVGMYRRNSH